MTPRDLAAIDSRAVLSGETPVTITFPGVGGAVYETTGQVIRIGLDIDAQGMPVAANKCAVTVPLADLTEQGLADPEALKIKGIAIAFVLEGESFAGTIDSVMIDRTLSRVTAILKRSS